MGCAGRQTRTTPTEAGVLRVCDHQASRHAALRDISMEPSFRLLPPEGIYSESRHLS